MMSSCNLFILLLLASSTISSEFGLRSSLHIMVILPESKDSDTTDSPLSFQPQEVLSSAKQAVFEINNRTEILNSFSVELIPIQSMKNDPYSLFIQFFAQLQQISKRNSLIGLVGVVSDKQEHILLQVAGHSGIDIVQLVDPIVPLDRNLPHTFTPYPSLAFHMEAAVQIVVNLQWNRIGLVYNSTSDMSVYIRAARTFMALIKETKTDIDVIKIDMMSTFVSATINSLEESGALAFLCLLPISVCIEVISISKQKGSNYAWMFAENNESGIWQTSAVDLSYTLIIRNIDVASRFNVTASSPLPNKTGDFVYCSIWELCLAVNSTLQTLNGFVSKQNIIQSVTNVLDYSVFLQRYNQTNFLFGIYSSNNQVVGYFNAQSKIFNINVTIDIPGLGPNVSYTYSLLSPTITYFTSSAMGVSLFFTTVLLILFVYLRKEPEIKATSISLTLCMFLACYFILLGTLFFFISSGHIHTSRATRILGCSTVLYLVSPGIDLLFATLLAKVLRIWRIFSLPRYIGKIWRDYSLLGFIGIVIGVKILLVIIWTIADPFIVTDVERVVRKDIKYEITQVCFSRYENIWIVLLHGYSVTIALLLIVASIKTRKIKKENFKDTKKISILLTTLIFMAAVSGSLWGILRLIGSGVASNILVGLMYFMIAILSEVFFFLPKILPAILRRFNIPMSKKLSKRSN